jgi:hypothetical protein
VNFFGLKLDSSLMAKRNMTNSNRAHYKAIPDSSKGAPNTNKAEELSILHRALRFIIYTIGFLVVLVAGLVALLGAWDLLVTPIRAGCEVTVNFKETCGSVQQEIQRRVYGQYGAWHDPHNNGTYSFIVSTDIFLVLTEAFSPPLMNVPIITCDC